MAQDPLRNDEAIKIMKRHSGDLLWITIEQFKNLK